MPFLDEGIEVNHFCMAAQCFHHRFSRDAGREGRQGGEDGTFRHLEYGDVGARSGKGWRIRVRARLCLGGAVGNVLVSKVSTVSDGHEVKEVLSKKGAVWF